MLKKFKMVDIRNNYIDLIKEAEEERLDYKEGKPKQHVKN
jgi:hypothetical protein